MGAQLAQYQNQGMSRDVSGSIEQNKLAYENLNIRITTRGQETLLITTNEKGNKSITITDSTDSTGNTNLSIIGVLLGYAVLGSHLILFTHEDSSDEESEEEEGPDRIYHIIHDNDDDSWSGYLMVEGDLNFDNEWPIETLVDYEGDTVQKVYWVDGRNQPRMLNFIEDDDESLQEKFETNSSYFDFVTKFTVNPLLAYSITKSYDSISNFHSGTVQYFFTYSNKYGQETNIVNLTDLQYLSCADRGADAESTVPCKFTIELSNVDTSFDYLNIYSVVTTSYNTTQAAYKVVELAINGSDELSYVDDGSYDTANATDADSLLYIGGRVIVPYTMTAKDQVLFLGNYIYGTGNSDDNEEYIAAIRSILRTDIYTEAYLSTNNITDDQNRPLVGINPKITFVSEVDTSDDAEEVTDGTSHGITEIDYVGASGLYPYTCQLKETSGKITVFKGGELYRFGVQFMDSTGALSQVFWIGDQWNDVYPSIKEDDATISRAVANYTLPLTNTIEIDGETVSLADCLQALDYQVVTLMIAQASSSDRRILAQGALCPTMYNLKQRCDGTVWSVPSWYFRPKGVSGGLPYNHGDGTLPNTEQNAEIQCIDEEGSPFYDITDDSTLGYYKKVVTLKTRRREKASKRYGWEVTVETYKTSSTTNPTTTTKSDFNRGLSAAKRSLNDYLTGTVGLTSNEASPFLSAAEAYLAETYQGAGWLTAYEKTFYASPTNGMAVNAYIKRYRNQYYIDESIVTFHSPEITEDTATNFDQIDPKLRIVGIAEVTANISDYTLDVDNPIDSSSAHQVDVDLNHSNISANIFGLIAYPLWYDKGAVNWANINAIAKGEDDLDTIFVNNTYYMIYPWHKEGSLTCLKDSDTGDSLAKLNSKVEANLRFSYTTRYLWATNGEALSDSYDDDEYSSYSSNGGWASSEGIETLRAYWYTEPQQMQLYQGGNPLSYQGIYDYVLSSYVSDEDWSNGYSVYNTGTETPESVAYGYIKMGEANDCDDTNVADWSYIIGDKEDDYSIGGDSYDWFSTNESGLMVVSPDGFHWPYVYSDTLTDYHIGCIDPVRIAYKSAPHAVVSFKTSGSSQIILPEIGDDVFEMDSNTAYIWDVNTYLDETSDTLITTTYYMLSFDNDLYTTSASGTIYSGDDWTKIFTDMGITTSNSTPDRDYYLLYGTSESYLKLYKVSSVTCTKDEENSAEYKLSLEIEWMEFVISHSTDDYDETTIIYNIAGNITKDDDDNVTDSITKIEIQFMYATSQPNADDWEEDGVDTTTATISSSIRLDDSESTETEEGFTTDGDKSTSISRQDEDATLYYRIVVTVSLNETATSEYGSSTYIYYTGTYEADDAKEYSENPPEEETISETIATNYVYNYVLKFSVASLSSLPVVAYYYLIDTTKKLTKNGSYVSIEDYSFVTASISQDKLSGSTDQPYVFIAELYMDKDRDEYYGGISDSALENNTFIMAGKRTTIDFDNGTTLIGTEGDAFFQRWDCLKTYPYSTDYTNSIVDIFSFMVETHVNIDGRYDNRRGLTENRNNTTENFGLINKVYTQENNFVSGNIFDESTDETSYSNCVTWTTAKTPMADTDAWTNLTIASTLPMDGRYGQIELLESNGSDIFCVQDKAVAKIRYNSNSAISTSDGVPIQLAMSGVVDGKVYATTAFGCQNKWSAHLLGGALYFVDNINEEFVTLGASDYYGQNKVEGLLSKNGFKDWLKNFKLGIERWNPVDFGNFKTYVDTNNMDVYYVLGSDADDGYKTALCYSSMLGKFESYYSYGGTPMMVNIDDKFISFHADDSDDDSENGLLWEQGAGEYNSIWGKDYPYWIVYHMSPNPLLDKIYGNIEYKADIFDMDRPEKDDDGNVADSDEGWREDKGMLTQDTFDYMKVWNEYQWNEVSIDASTLLRGNWDKYPDIRQKFRTWRIDIPRDRKNKDNPYGLNRMRNPWLGLKLAKTTAGDLAKHGRMEFYNLILKYWSA